MTNYKTRPLVKICGITNQGDAQMAARLGADYLGIIVGHPPSPRHVEFEAARALFAAAERPAVAVVVNLSLDELLRLADALAPAALQLHGDESPSLVRQLKARGLTVWAACSSNGQSDGSAGEEAVKRRAHALTEAGAGADAILLDAARITNESGIVYGGTGKLSDWRLAQSLVEDGLRVVLAGGLSPDNVAEAVHAVAPWMVDVLSGVEARKGIKDEEKVRRFTEAARSVQY